MAGKEIFEAPQRVDIDAGDLAEARRDPRVHSLLTEAAAEGERVLAEGRDHTGIHEGLGGTTMDAIHARHGTRAATAEELQ